MTEPVPVSDSSLRGLMNSEVWKDSQDVLVKHLLRTYGEGFSEALQMAAQLVDQVLQERADLNTSQRLILREMADVFVATAAQVPPVYTPPPPEVVDQDC